MSSPIIITLPKFVSTNMSSSPVFKDYIDCKSSENVKGRKRRLDHLSWEEKLQRKKLKNRVAAQTSRDRKKLKMDDMESTIKDLMDQNQLLIEECQKLRDLNSKLTSENQQLRDITTQNSSVDADPSRSAEGRRTCVGSCSVQGSSDAAGVEDAAGLHAEDLFDLDFDKLEEFAQSLLEDITSDLEATSAERQTQPDNLQQNHPGEMVGTAPKQLEPCGDDSLVPAAPLEPTTDQQSSTVVLPPNLESQDMIYATIDDPDSCVTIIVANGDDEPTNEVEVVAEETRNLAEFVSSYTVSEDDDVDGVNLSLESVRSEKALSDCGYESLGSPHSESSDVEMSELWNQSFTELFPNLM